MSPGRTGIRFGRACFVLVCLATTVMIAGMDCQAQWSERTDRTYNYWVLNDHDKFRWHIALHQWWHFSTQGSTWKTLSNPGIDWGPIYDGGWRDMGYGLKYRYYEASDYGFFTRGASYRFYYRYDPGQWYTSGYGGGWYKIGSAGLSAGVLGDGGTYDLGGGIKFRYAAYNDLGFYYNQFTYRFYYRYTPGQWYTSGFGGGWHTVGGVGTSGAVLAGGYVCDLGNGVKFRYYAVNDYGFYYLNYDYRFYYRYLEGQWYHSGYGGGWYQLGNVGLNATAIWDGEYHNLDTHFWYRYAIGGVESVDLAYWSTNGTTGGDRFRYTYASGLWDHSGYGGGWYQLGNVGLNATAIWDGEYHNLGSYVIQPWMDTRVWYRYAIGGVESVDLAYWSMNGTIGGDRFRYTYASGLWEHQGPVGGFNPIGHGDMSASFIGDGGTHYLYNGYSYYYTYFEAECSLGPYRYQYWTGVWLVYVYGPSYAGWVGIALGSTGLFNPGEP